MYAAADYPGGLVVSTRLSISPAARRVTSLSPIRTSDAARTSFPSSVCVRLYPRVRTFKGESDSRRAASVVFSAGDAWTAMARCDRAE